MPMDRRLRKIEVRAPRYSFACVEDRARGRVGGAHHRLRAAFNFSGPLQTALKPGYRRYRNHPGEDV
jgi:hypothetical protein